MRNPGPSHIGWPTGTAFTCWFSQPARSRGSFAIDTTACSRRQHWEKQFTYGPRRGGRSLHDGSRRVPQSPAVLDQLDDLLGQVLLDADADRHRLLDLVAGDLFDGAVLERADVDAAPGELAGQDVGDLLQLEVVVGIERERLVGVLDARVRTLKSKRVDTSLLAWSTALRISTWFTSETISNDGIGARAQRGNRRSLPSMARARNRRSGRRRQPRASRSGEERLPNRENQIVRRRRSAMRPDSATANRSNDDGSGTPVGGPPPTSPYTADSLT